MGINRKALDNILARLDLPEAPVGRQGLERRIPVSLLPVLALTSKLVGDLGVSVRPAFALAERLSTGVSTRVGVIELRADLPELVATLEHRLEHAIESVVRRPRGRPRASREEFSDG